MRDVWDEHEELLEQLVKWLTVFTFVLLCWTLHRAIRPRLTCVTSTLVRAVVMDGQRVNNCVFESRLQVGGPNLTTRSAVRLRQIEAMPELGQWFAREPKILIEIDDKNPRAFDLFTGGARIGAGWFDDGPQLRRAIAMTVLKMQPSFTAATAFQLETMADFILATIGADESITGTGGRRLDWWRDVKFATAPSTLGEYCRSPLRSLAHENLCGPTATTRASFKQATLWGFRPLLASALARNFARLPLRQKVAVIAHVRTGPKLPTLEAPRGTSVDKLVDWFAGTYRAHAAALGLNHGVDPDATERRTMTDLGVESPLNWELTFDLRYTPAWRAIVTQLLERAQYRRRERALVFTPEGGVVLPSGLPVAWAPGDVRSRKHVMIACQFPPSKAAALVRADHVIPHQSCVRLGAAFWD